MISRIGITIWLLLISQAIIFSCSVNEDSNPISPQNQLDVNESNSDLGSMHYLWSYQVLYLDPDENIVQVIPVREAETHLNILRWLEQSPCTNCLKITSLTQQPDGTLVVGIRIIHPFTNPNLTGFDVRGTVIFDAGSIFPSAGLTYSNEEAGDSVLRNPDGYTTLYNSSTIGSGPGGLQGYIKGKFAPLQAPDGLLNGYKRFSTEGTSNTRNAFLTNQFVDVTYEIHKSSGPIQLGYAVDASWAPPSVLPVNDPIQDFPPDANCPEPWKISTICDPIVGSGNTLLTIDVYDWQGYLSHHAPVVECPELFVGETNASLVSIFSNYSRWEATIPNSNGAQPGLFRCLVSVEANENDPANTPWLDLTAYQITDISVVSSETGWARTWGDAGMDQGLNIATYGSDSIYVSGLFSGTVDFDPGSGTAVKTSYGQFDCYLSKFNSDGDLVWVHTWGGSSDDAGYCLDTDSSGEIYVGGYFNGETDFDPDPSQQDIKNSNNGSGSFISKFDENGNYEWVHTWDVYGNSQARDLDVGPDDAVYVVGYERISTGQFSCYLRKLTTSGTMEYHKLWSGINYFVPFDDEFSVCTDSFNNVYVTGLFDGSKDFDPGPDSEIIVSKGYYDAFLSKFKTDGTYEWSITWGSPSYQWECGSGVSTDSAGDVYVCGYWGGDTDFDPGNGVEIHTADGWDAYVMKLNQDGNFQWAKTWGGPDSFVGDWGYGDAATDLVIDSANNIYVSGNFATSTDFDPGAGTYTVTTNSFTDSYLLKLTVNGEFQWVRTWGGNDDCCQAEGELFWETSLAVTVSSTDSVFFTGIYSSENFNEVDFANQNSPCNENADMHTPDDEYESYLIKVLPDGCW